MFKSISKAQYFYVQILSWSFFPFYSFLHCHRKVAQVEQEYSTMFLLDFSNTFPNGSVHLPSRWSAASLFWKNMSLCFDMKTCQTLSAGPLHRLFLLCRSAPTPTATRQILLFLILQDSATMSGLENFPCSRS